MSNRRTHLIEAVAETGSTSSDLLTRLRGGETLPEGFWLIADRQTAGHGRMGRAWSDGVGNFMGTSVVRLAPGDPPASSLALVAGLAVREACAQCANDSAPLVLKWPNDLLAGEAKLAGILLEREGEAVVVGIGVNLAVAPQVDGRVTAALAQLGAVPGRDTFARILAAALAEELSRWRAAGLPALIRRWLALAHPPGTELSVSPPGEPLLKGRFAGLAEDGALQLSLGDGTTRTIHAGEVQLLPGQP